MRIPSWLPNPEGLQNSILMLKRSDMLPGLFLLLRDIDSGALAAWTAAGIQLFQKGKVPSIQAVVGRAKQVLLLHAAERHNGDVEQMAMSLGASRQSTRELMRIFGLSYKQGVAEESASGSSPQDAKSEILAGDLDVPEDLLIDEASETDDDDS